MLLIKSYRGKLLGTGTSFAYWEIFIKKLVMLTVPGSLLLSSIKKYVMHIA